MQQRVWAAGQVIGVNLLLFQLPSTYTFFTKALGLSDEEIQTLLHRIYTKKVDHKVGAMMIDEARERRYIFSAANTLQVRTFVLGGFSCWPPWDKIHYPWQNPRSGGCGLFIPLSHFLFRLVMLTWMTSSLWFARKSPPLFRFLCDSSYAPRKVDLRPFEDVWAKRVGIKCNLKKGILIDSLISFLVPDVSQLILSRWWKLMLRAAEKF